MKILVILYFDFRCFLDLVTRAVMNMVMEKIGDTSKLICCLLLEVEIFSY